jgi:hypothetical protein
MTRRWRTNTNTFAISVSPQTNDVRRFRYPFLDAVYDRFNNNIVGYDGVALWRLNPNGPRLLEPSGDFGGAPRLAIGPDGVAYFGLYGPAHGHWAYIGQFPGNAQLITTTAALVDMEVSPTNPALLAVSFANGTFLYNNGTLLPASVLEKGNVRFSSDGAKLYIGNTENCSLSINAATANGIVLEKTVPTLSCSDFIVGGGLLLFDSGLIYDPALGQSPAGAPTFVPPAFFAPNGYAGFDVMNRSNSVWTVRRYRRTTTAGYEQFASREVGAIPNSVLDLFSAGEDRVAYRTASEIAWLDLPGDPSSIRARIERQSGNQIAIGFTSVQGAQYRIELRNEITTGQWASVGGELAGNGGLISQAVSTDGAARAYYRIVRLP